MAFQTIRLKNTNVAGKVPTAGQLDTAELVLNLKDHKLFSKDADGNVFELGQTGVPGGGDPPDSGNETGDLWWDGDNLLIWNGVDWEVVGAVTSVNSKTGDVVLELNDIDDVDVDGVTDNQVLVYDAGDSKWIAVSAASLTVDVDLGYTPAADKGTVTNSAGDDAELPLADASNAGLMSPESFSKVDDGPTIISDGKEPDSPALGDLWFDTNDCPPTLNIWSDCDGEAGWKPISGGSAGGNIQLPVSISSSNGTELNSTLTAQGGGGVDADGTAINATYAWSGAKSGTGSTILADIEGTYTVTATVEFKDGTKQSTSTEYDIADSYVDMTNLAAPVVAVIGEGPDGAYEGNRLYVQTDATVSGGANPKIIQTQWFKDGVADGNEDTYLIGAGDVGKKITAKQLFRDDRVNDLLSNASNEITLVDRPVEAITFDAVINDDGTAAGNQIGKTLTAEAQNITGGTAPEVKSYQWYADGAPEAGGDSQTKEILGTDIGKTITCKITVAEPDGSNAEERTATYARTPENTLVVGKGSITPNTDVTTGTKLTGSATVTGGFVPETTHVWELNGVEDQRGTVNTYTAKEGTVRYRAEVTDLYSTEIGEWSEPVTVTAPVGPTATMSGLRFDSAKEALLARL